MFETTENQRKLIKKILKKCCILKNDVLQFSQVVESGKKWYPWVSEVRPMLIGEYEHSLDDKGRAIMPVKLRADIGERFIITKGLDGCLFVFSQLEWSNFETKLKELPLTNKNARDFVRFFLSGATECELDKQGRFLIANNLRAYADITKELVIIGVGTRLELWNKDKWKIYNSDENISADNIAENMTMLGI